MKRPALMAFLAGLLPVVAVCGAYWLNIHAASGLDARFTCFPYLDGCVSISRAARSGPGLHLFRAVMLPCAVLLFLTWGLVAGWLTGIAACSRRRARLIKLLGATGAAFLVLYVTWLGTDGDWYRWLRRYGVTVYFAGTALAQLLLVSVLWPRRRHVLQGRLARPVAVLTALVSVQWLLGVASVVKRLLLDDPALVDRIENVIEWSFGLPMSLSFIVIAWMFRLSGFRLHSRFDR